MRIYIENNKKVCKGMEKHAPCGFIAGFICDVHQFKAPNCNELTCVFMPAIHLSFDPNHKHNSN